MFTIAAEINGGERHEEVLESIFYNWIVAESMGYADSELIGERLLALGN